MSQRQRLRLGMLKYELVSADWFVSLKARTVYRLAAVLSVMLCVAIWLVLADVVPLRLSPFIRLIILLGILGGAITIVGMEFFLFRFDESHAVKQLVWFFVMLIPLLGAPLYCFCVYSRSKVFSSETDRAESATA